MKTQSFELEQALKAWRHTLKLQRTFLVDDLDELEDHLRNEIDTRMQSGQAAREAFLTASRDLGSFVELDEMYQQVRFGRKKAGSNVARDLLFSFSMYRHFIRSSCRSLIKHPGQSAINILGLSVAIVACMFLGLFVRHELSFDQFHENADRIFRVRALNDGQWVATLSAVNAERMDLELPEVESTVRLFKHWETPLLAYQNKGGLESGLYFADSTFFSFFSFPLVLGSPNSVLTDPFSVVLSSSAARRYFGDGPAVGERIQYNSGAELTVTGIMEDIPDNSHIRPDFVVSMGTLPRVSYGGIMEEWSVFHTYATLRPLTNRQTVSSKLTALINQDRPENEGRRMDLQPIQDIHLHSGLISDIEVSGNARYVWIMSFLAGFIALIAAFNHINLTTARALRRVKEIAVRKVTGANQHKIFQQFLVEAFLQIGFALVLALSTLWLIRSTFDEIIGFNVFRGESLGLIIGFAVIVSVVMGLLAGTYPAYFMARTGPSSALKGSTGSISGGKTLRGFLVVFQFAVSTFLIVFTLAMTRQIDFIRSADLGFDEHRLMVVPIQGQQARSRYASLRDALIGLAEVESVGASSSTRPGMRHSQGHLVRRLDAGDSGDKEVQRNWVDSRYLTTIGAQLVFGEHFGDQAQPDDRAIILNETAVRALELPLSEELIGMQVYLNASTDPIPYTIRGIVSDFNFESLHQTIGPLVFTYNSFPTQLLIRLGNGNLTEASAAIKSVWSRFTDQPFSFTFLDQELDTLYQQEIRAGYLLKWSSGLALCIAALGLLGLMSFVAENRRKEIGIRKALGASVGSIMVMVSLETVRLVAVALIIATPVAYFGVDRWLSSFAYKTTPSLTMFVITACVLLGISVLTVGYHAGKSAIARPVETLRCN